MNEVKLAFETLIVGVFGLVCILVLVDLLRPAAGLWDRGVDLFKGSVGQSAVTGLLILPVAYVVGAAEFPLADDLLAAAVGIAVVSVFGLMEAEREFDKHIVGTYYAMRADGTGEWRDAEEQGPRDPPAPEGGMASVGSTASAPR